MVGVEVGVVGPSQGHVLGVVVVGVVVVVVVLGLGDAKLRYVLEPAVLLAVGRLLLDLRITGIIHHGNHSSRETDGEQTSDSGWNFQFDERESG